jgi:hypothetical protein
MKMTPLEQISRQLSVDAAASGGQYARAGSPNPA